MDVASVGTLVALVYARVDLFNAAAAIGCVVTFFILMTVAASLTRRTSLNIQGMQHAQLPPGSMGLLWLGETLQFLSSLRQGGPTKFMRERTLKFRSPIFKTSLFLHPAVVVQGADANRFLVNGENRQELRNSWPSFTLELLGWNAPPAVHGAQHKRQRQILSGCLGPGALQRVVGRAGTMTQKHVEAWWKDGERISVVKSVRNYAFHVAFSLLLGIEEEPALSEMERQFRSLAEGLAGLPINLPGSRFRKAIRARDQLRRQIDSAIRQRQNSAAAVDGEVSEELLSQLILARDENGCALSLEELRDVTLTLIVAGYDTAATTLTFALKFIEENPSCRYRLVQEHEGIASQKSAGERMSWADITNMRYTWAVLQETMRLRAPALGGVKETLKDIQYNGYTIPRGWKIFYTMAATHQNDEYFKNPSKFDPSRFEIGKLQKERLQPLSYVPFGIGPHACKGIDFARMSTSLYIHHLIMAKHKWTSLEPNEKISCLPMLTLAKGYPILVSS
ncbi:hypothetical protein GOP47_0010938 [Adiantum capillus-veneris]|uniref:Cytochrome P450 n=1 Tax=Adiantum capillus-veneris TaxID=13818 RepID=A0A9D4ZIB1_ADICA|nr:hypothetical protein GOP47_0010938 [Adiantum capillus-veneris]